MIEASGLVLSQLPYIPDYVSAGSDYLQAKAIPERASKVKDVFKDELSESETSRSRIKKIAALGSFVTSVVWEWGPFNELIAVAPAIELQLTTGNSWLSGAVGGSIYAAQSLIFGTTTAAAISVIPKTKAEYHEQFSTAEDDENDVSLDSEDEPVSKGRLKRIKKFAENTFLLLGVGESAAIGNRHIREKNRTFKQDMALVGKMTLALTAVDIAVGVGIVQAVDSADEIGVDQSTVIDTLTNPLIYVLGFGGIQVASHIVKQKRKMKQFEASQSASE